MSRPRLLFYIQHLLGIGHLVRGARIATAAARHFDVTVAIGGDLPDGLDFGAATLHRLPPVKAGSGGFSDLVTPDGRPFDEAMRSARREELLGLFARTRPDILLVEAFPFGRRQMRFELLPLLDAAKRRASPPLIVSSVRDILQEGRKSSRDAETVALIRATFDLVIVHGDPALAQLGDSFPLAGEIADKTVYSGLVGPPARADGPGGAVFDVIVSVGGGAVGAALIAAALAARPLSRLAQASWLVLTGPNCPAATTPGADPAITLRGFDPDLPALLRRARLSISQAGYNTVADLLSAPRCRPVLAPYAAGGETEQSRRAALMQERGLAVVVDAATLTPQTLAAAIDRALHLPERGAAAFDRDGAAQTGELLLQAVARRAIRPDLA